MKHQTKRVFLNLARLSECSCCLLSLGGTLLGVFSILSVVKSNLFQSFAHEYRMHFFLFSILIICLIADSLQKAE